jgi:hypothetical protein
MGPPPLKGLIKEVADNEAKPTSETKPERPAYVPQPAASIQMSQGGSGAEKRHPRNHKSWLRERSRNGKTWLQRKVASKEYCPAKTERGGR